MNKARRKQLDEAISKLEDAKAIIDSVREEEQDAFDNMPENLQSTGRGEAMESAISNMEDAVNDIDSVIDYINEASA